MQQRSAQARESARLQPLAAPDPVTARQLQPSARPHSTGEHTANKLKGGA